MNAASGQEIIMSSLDVKRPGGYGSLGDDEVVDVWTNRNSKMIPRWDLAGATKKAIMET